MLLVLLNYLATCTHPENQGRVEPQYRVSSTTIEEQDFFHTILCLCYMLNMVLYQERLSSFFTQVWISRTGGDGIYDVIVFLFPLVYNHLLLFYNLYCIQSGKIQLELPSFYSRMCPYFAATFTVSWQMMLRRTPHSNGLMTAARPLSRLKMPWLELPVVSPTAQF